MILNDLLGRCGRTAALVVSATACTGVALPAWGQQSPPKAAYEYQDSATGQEFVLDLSGGEPLLKFKNSNEVMALRSSTAQRGDDMLRSDSGQLMLRRTELGNIISYMGSKNGAPADIAGRADPLSSPPMPSSLTEKVKETASAIGRLVGHDVAVFGAGGFSEDEEWAADALSNTLVGVKTAYATDRNAAAALTNVRLQPARSAIAVFKDGELVLGVNPAEGYYGRPSSVAIAKAIIGR